MKGQRTLPARGFFDPFVDFLLRPNLMPALIISITRLKFVVVKQAIESLTEK